MSLSIIIPTIGRPTLITILQEIAPQLDDGDEVIVVGDGRQPDAERMSGGFGSRVRYLEFESVHCWGHPQRNWAMERATGSHLVFFDDDDAVKPNALDTIRHAVLQNPKSPLVFRMHYGSTILWRDRAVRCGNVSTQMFVVPNRKSLLGEWGGRYEGDLDFIQSTSLKYPDGVRSIVWREEITAVHGLGGRDPRR